MSGEKAKSDKVKQGLLNWIKLNQKYPGYNITRMLHINGINDIAIYGVNEIGLVLAYELLVICGRCKCKISD